ncbi:hypothetical protein K7X08_010140 [Anisodus acutangulus]|uniref:Uncharacterized protein n=1 Tax=Anisodus acutangulus TaxID=402998 RepID=A0A9Q1N0S4_9SOLA|nr:hypothetical protein K7X08_010140 [Anisodus acutangulus]
MHGYIREASVFSPSIPTVTGDYHDDSTIVAAHGDKATEDVMEEAELLAREQLEQVHDDHGEVLVSPQEVEADQPVV